MVIDDSLTASYVIQGSSVMVTEAVNLTINPNDTMEFTFSMPINLATTVDSIFEVRSWIDLSGDPVPENDSTDWTSISSLLSPAPPQVANVTISQGDSTTLHILSPDTNMNYHWYDAMVGGNELMVGDSFTTPPLYQNTVYYAEARSGGKVPVLITEINIGGTDAIEIQNMSNTVMDFTGWKVALSNNYTTINSVNANIKDLGVMQPGQVRSWSDLSSDPNYWGSNILWNPGSAPTYTGWAVIIDDLGNIVDLVFLQWPAAQISTWAPVVNGHQLSLGNEWSGNGVPGAVDYIVRVAYDVNDGTDWVNQASGTIGQPNPPMTFSGGGGGGGNGCPSPRTPDTVFVTSPVIAVNAGNDTSMCADGIQLNVTASGGTGVYSYAWSPAGSLNSATIANPVASPVTNTTYSVTVTDNNGDTGSDGVIVLVNPGPNVTMANIPNICINYAPYTLTQGSPAGGVYSGPGVTAGVLNPLTAGVGTHTITYTYTDPVTGCSGSATKTVIVDLCIGLGEIENGLGLSVYPNPSSGMVTVSLYSEESSVLLSLVDVTGKVVMEERELNARGVMTRTFDLSTLPRGVYYLRLQGAEYSTAEKVVLR